MSPNGSVGPPEGRRHRHPQWAGAGTTRARAARVRAAAAISCEARRHPAHKHTRFVKYRNKTSLKVTLRKEREKKKKSSHLLRPSRRAARSIFQPGFPTARLEKPGLRQSPLRGGTASPRPFAGSSAERRLKH